MEFMTIKIEHFHIGNNKCFSKSWPTNLGKNELNF